MAFDLKVGQTTTRMATFTDEHVRQYSEITGDRNPLHNDAAFTSQTRFKTLIVQGGLTTGVLHALIAMDMPGPGSVFLEQHWKFTSPVFIGDTVTAHAEVKEVHPRKPVARLAFRMTRQTGDVVLEGEAWTYTTRPGGQTQV